MEVDKTVMSNSDCEKSEGRKRKGGTRWQYKDAARGHSEMLQRLRLGLP